MTVFFQSHQITIRRLRSVGGYKMNYSATYTVYDGDIQPLQSARVNEAGGRVSKAYEAWIDSEIDVKEGDQIDSGGKRYSVKAVSTFSGAGLLDHTHLILEAQN